MTSVRAPAAFPYPVTKPVVVAQPMSTGSYFATGATAYHHVGADGGIMDNKVIGTAIVGGAIYHGYKRNNSVGWAVGWGLLASAFPLITGVIAVAQGFGKPKRG